LGWGDQVHIWGRRRDEKKDFFFPFCQSSNPFLGAIQVYFFFTWVIGLPVLGTVVTLAMERQGKSKQQGETQISLLAVYW
jgi:hypothetical protein